MLAQAGFNYVEINLVDDSDKAAFTVLKQSENPNAEVDVTTTIVLEVSSGKMTVPNVVGKSAADAKTGAVRMAAKLKVPIVPVYISRNKKFFRKAKLIIGKPIPVPAGTHEEYEAFAGQLMADISEMGREEA